MSAPKRRATDVERVRIVDTDDGETLTMAELLELKRLANLSRFARWVAGGLIAVSALVGGDRLVDMGSRGLAWLKPFFR